MAQSHINNDKYKNIIQLFRVSVDFSNPVNLVVRDTIVDFEMQLYPHYVNIPGREYKTLHITGSVQKNADNTFDNLMCEIHFKPVTTGTHDTYYSLEEAHAACSEMEYNDMLHSRVFKCELDKHELLATRFRELIAAHPVPVATEDMALRETRDTFEWFAYLEIAEHKIAICTLMYNKLLCAEYAETLKYTFK